VKIAPLTRSRAVLPPAAGVIFLSLIASASSAPNSGWQGRVSHDLLNLYSAATLATSATSAPSAGSAALSSTVARFDARGRVQVDVHVDCAAAAPATALAAAGLKIGTAVHLPPYCVVEGWAPAASVPALASVAGVTRVKLPAYAWHRQPRVPPVSGGVAAPRPTMPGGGLAQGGGGPAIDGSAITIMRADQYISQTTVNGAGVAVGVMSDDVTSLAAIQGRGELPTAIANVTPSGATNPTPTDEGTMMLEEVHAVAPGAALAFCGPETSVNYIACLGNLVAAGASVLVDDLAYPGEDMLSSSGTFAQGVQNFLAQNPQVVLFTVTENYNGSYWEGAYAPLALASLGGLPQTCGTQTDNYIESFAGQYWQALTVYAAGTYPLGFQWADPFDQNVSNFDIYIEDTSGAVSCANAAGSTATEIRAELNLPVAGTYYLWIATPDASLNNKFLKLFVGGDGATELSLPTSGSTISPQAFVAGVVTIGAVSGANGIGNTIEPYSGIGPINLVFPAPTALQAPSVVAPDAIYVDAAGTDFASELPPDGYFHGTSAAAPNAAAVAALLRSAFPSLNPTQLTAALESGAVYLGSGSPNSTYGYGRVDALGALGTIPAPTMSSFPSVVVVGGSSSPAAPFTVSGVGNLRLSVKSSNPALIPASLVAAGTPGVTVAPATCGAAATACTISFAPVIGLTGSAQITLIATDGANRTASITSTVTVTQPPPPTIAVGAGGAQSLTTGTAAAPVAFTVAGTGALAVSANSSNPGLVSGVAISSGCGTKMAACTASLSLMPSQSGTATVTFRVKDAWNGVGQATATMNVAAPSSGGGGAVDSLTLAIFAAVTLGACRRRMHPRSNCPRHSSPARRPRPGPSCGGGQRRSPA
jgi:Subtilase family